MGIVAAAGFQLGHVAQFVTAEENPAYPQTWNYKTMSNIGSTLYVTSSMPHASS